MPKTAVGCTVYGYLQKKLKEQKHGNTPASRGTVDPSGGEKGRDCLMNTQFPFGVMKMF